MLPKIDTSIEKNPKTRKRKLKEKLSGEVNAYVIIAILILLAVIATWLVPAGQYDRVMDKTTSREIVQAGSFHLVQKSPVGFWETWKLIQKGFMDANVIILFILVVGGSFGLLTQTGSIKSLIAKVVCFFKGKPYEKWSFIFIFAVLFSFSMTFGFAEQGIIFVPFIAMMAVSMGYDPIVAVATVVFATSLGYAGSLTGPFNVSIAQQVAGLPLYSGLWFRAVSAVVIFGISAWYLLKYATKVKKDPLKSLVSHLDFSKLEMDEDPEKVVMTGLHKRVLILFGTSVVFMIYAMLRLNFGMPELTSYFMLVGVLIGIVSRMKAGEIADRFVDGAKSLLYPALLVGFARGVQTIMESGVILDSLINYVVQPLSYMPTLLVPGMMVFVQSMINLIIPSSSAMAVVSMPIMAPLADLLEIQRQTATLAYQFGDGITNLILPSYSVLIGALGLARVPFGKWFRFAVPLAAILTIAVIILATIAEWIKVGPF
ncbi:YfcC family protein [Fictibacillus fluitans]|uniref:AbgT family transporter n=1 Tax=Fictibacillus fluitans TaxID=3058422 RepID=A0ABT8HRH0_9BACL|nr:AbgT family transporter [Fictibacillus sp. NE201]MDN4523358.1 AbgT family transporter [Fictibacillus sp. NE201]